jgi:hypothetical protein
LSINGFSLYREGLFTGSILGFIGRILGFDNQTGLRLRFFGSIVRVSAYIVLSLVCMSVFLVWLPIPACIPEAFLIDRFKRDLRGFNGSGTIGINDHRKGLKSGF